MFRTITSIVLFVILVGGDAATGASFCGSSVDHKGDRPAVTYCKGAATNAETPMSCCQHMPLTHPEAITKASADCCQMSRFPDEGRSAPPANCSEEFRLQTHSRLLEPLPSSAMALAWASSTIAYCPDRSDTYLLASSFRI